ncbi:MAG: long-chain fatty acid--CoA ligase, partial [Actinomycetota bacterium]|nr:long-chain fatty acid--CoA ligase [Actinomycetota bacterium]
EVYAARMTIERERLSHDTVVGRFQARAHEWAEYELWYLKDDEGRWQPISWLNARLRVEAIAAGLLALGIAKGDRVGLVGKNLPSWVATDYGIQHCGAVGVPVYPTNAPDQIAYVLTHSASRVYFVDDQEQLDKALGAHLPNVERIVAHHLDHEDDGRVMGIGRLRELGEEWLDAHRGELSERMASIGPDDPLSIIYTSGTTGPPKGVVLTHRNCIWTAEQTARRLKVHREERVISYLPLSHIFERLVTTMIPLATEEARFVYYFVPLLTGLPAALKEVRPTLFVAVPRVWEKFRARILSEVAEAPALRQRIFHFAVHSGTEAVRMRDEGGRPGPMVKLGAALATKAVGKKVLPEAGLDRCWYAVSGAAPLGGEVQRFFQALGLPLHQGWGLTETTAACTVQPPQDLGTGSVGTPLDGVELSLDEDREILVRGPNVFREYYQDPEKTTEAFDEDGWFRTGDVGELLPGGRLRIVDRKKDLIITSGGKNVAPQELEQRLKTDSLIGEAMVVGDARPYLVALIALDADEARGFLHHKGEDVREEAELAEHPLIEEHVAQVVDDVNRRFSRAENVRKWMVVRGGFPDEAITPTMKLKRRVVNDRLAKEIEALYA